MPPDTIAAVYSRISLDRTGEGLGVERQEQDCRDLVLRRGWQPGPVYRENSKSASTLTTNRRPVYDAMLRHASEGQFGVIVAHSTSRLTRRPHEFEQLVSLVSKTGLKICTVTSGELDLDSADGRAMARILTAMDAAETERLGERAARAALQRARSDVWLGGTVPCFGYDFAPRPEGGLRLVPNPVASQWLREAAVSIMRGVPVTDVTREWNRRGYRTALGQRWKVPDLRRILLSPHTAGRRERAGVLSEQLWEPVLDLDTWTALREKIVEDSAPTTRRAPLRALSSLAFCGQCGAPLETRVNRHGYDMYECWYPLHHGCARVRIRAEALERHVSQAALRAAVTAPESHSLSMVGLLRLRTVQMDHYDRLLDRDGFRRQLNRVLAAEATTGDPPDAAVVSGWATARHLEILDLVVTERPSTSQRYWLPTPDQAAERVTVRWAWIPSPDAAGEASG